MPVKTAKRTVRKTVDLASQLIRKHWSEDETRRRRETAEIMQQRLVGVLGLNRAAPR